MLCKTNDKGVIAAMKAQARASHDRTSSGTLYHSLAQSGGFMKLRKPALAEPEVQSEEPADAYADANVDPFLEIGKLIVKC